MESIPGTKQELNTRDKSSARAPSSFDTPTSAENKHHFQRGLRWLGLGIFLMAVSFGINFLLFGSDTSFVTTMYILTSLGAACIFKGLVDILGF